MNNTRNSIVYAVNSDLDDEILYAEFDNKDAAIAYAKRNLDKLPFVDELHVSRDANGEIDDVFEYKTTWDHTMADETKEEAENDYWDDLETMYDAKEDGKHVIGDTTWFESMNNLVETLEENEDMVECKECFELFPKAECIKVAVGYICPTCAECGTVSEEDLFKMDFPECEKMSVGNDMIPDEPAEEIPSAEAEAEIDSISTPEEAIPFLIKDEEEAIAGYEEASKVIADSDVENKEDVLKVLDHIKEEEEEHIEELTDLTIIEDSEDETDPISKDEVEEIEDSEVTESALTEHVNEEHPAVESTQELEGTDNAVVDCKVAKVVTHSEDEKPVDCEGKREPLNKALTEAFTRDELSEIFKLCKEIGIVTGEDLSRFIREVPEGENLLDKLRAYRAELGDDFKIEEKLTEAKSDFFRDVIFEAIDYLTEFSDIFPVPENISVTNWEELKDDINYGLSSDFEIAEIIMEYLQKDLAISEKHPEIFKDDPQSELTLETYNKLKRAYDRAVIEYKAKYPEDFEERLDLTHQHDQVRCHRKKENLAEDADEGEDFSPTSADPAEKPSKDVKMANTAGLTGMDFEAACRKFGVNLED